MKKLLVFLIPFILLVGCGDESTEKTPETEELGNETVIENSGEETAQDGIEEDTNVVDEDKSSNVIEEKEDTKKNDKPVAEKPVVKENAETKEKYLNQLNGIESGLRDLNKQYENGTQTEMHQAKAEIYTKWDDALNEIYGVLQKQLSANEMSSLKEEQRNWIKQRDQKSKDEAAVFEGGTMEAVIYVSTQAQLTKERCYELVENYMK